MSKSKRFYKSKIKCFTCHKPCHLTRDCPKRRGSDDSIQIAVASDDDSYDNASALVVSSVETAKGWVLDSVCSYNMCSRKEYFETLKLEQGEVFFLGDNKT